MKSLSEFYRHAQMADGHLGKCKECTKRDSKTRLRRVGRDPIWAAKERERSRNRPARVRVAATQRPYKRKWAKNNQDKRHAHFIAYRAFKRGVLIKPEACAGCGVSTAKLERHHDDYAKPLEVRWLCAKCHGLTRRK